MTASIYDIPVNHIDGTAGSLREFAGKVVLIVNVASKCGLTPQYDALEKLYDEYGAQGFVVAGFPANDFGAQEPGSNDEIAAFCRGTFGVKFPMFEKIVVTGANKHPLYAALTAAQPAPDSPAFRAKLENYGIKTNPAPEVLWNFEKFLIDRQGNIVNRFAPNVAPDDASIVATIKSELAKT